MYEYWDPYNPPKRKSHSGKIVVFFLCIAVGWGLVWLLQAYSPKESIISPLSSFFSTKSLQKDLTQIVNKELEDSTGTYSVVVVNLKNDDRYIRDEGKVYTAASLYKLWIMAVAYEQITDGILKENEELAKDAVKLNEAMGIATESAEIKEGVVSYTVSEALRQMIVVSHNYAALLLSDRVSLTSVRKWLERNGFENSDVRTNPPTTTAKDTALFLEKLYNKEFVNSEKMLELLKKQQLNGKIPKELPDDVVVAHKTGELENVSHDAGIVFTDSGNYILVVMSESGNRAGADDRIANISKAVYDYFDKQ